MAFSELHRRHYPSLRAFVFHLLGSRHRHEDAEDVVQDAFARAFNALSERTFSGDFRRWIFTIARNRSIDLLRGERVRLVSLDAEEIDAAVQVAAEATTPVAVAESREEVAWLVAAIEKLPERQRSALLLRELAGLSHLEIAEMLDTTAGSARQLITRARDGIRDAAERDGREHETRKRRSLQRELLDAAPVLPLAAVGVMATAGTTAAGGLAIGKIVATVLAAMVLASTAGVAEREVTLADAARSSPDTQPAVPVVPAQIAERNFAPAERVNSYSRSTPESFDIEVPGEQKTKAPPDESSPDAEQPKPATDETSSEAPRAPASDSVPDEGEVVQQVEKIVQLPVKVVENVVGKVVDDATGTLVEVTSGLLGASSR